MHRSVECSQPSVDALLVGIGSVCDSLKDVGSVDGHARMEGRMMAIMLAPLKKKGVSPMLLKR